MTLGGGRRPAAGYSLTELMIVLVVLSVGILALARLIPTASRQQVRDRLRTSAAYYAQEKIEVLRSLTLDDPDMADGPHPIPGPSETVGPNGTYARSWTVSHLVPPLDNVARVDVLVTWNDSNGPDTVVATTYVNH